MTIHLGIVSTAKNLAILGIICVVATGYHGIKRNSNKSPATTKNRKKKRGNDADERPKLVIISGCDRGFGRYLAESLAQSDGKRKPTLNYRVLALTLEESSSAELLRVSSSTLYAMKCDVTAEKDIEKMKQYAKEILIREKAVLYSIVNNAGIVDPGDFAWFDDTSVYENVMTVNYFGQLRVTNALLPLMLKTSQSLSPGFGPRILNLSSVCGTTSSPSNGAYSASKFAIEAWSDSIRIELRPFNIHVVKIRPGQISTQIQSDWGRNCLKNFNAASLEIRELYGGTKFVAKMESLFQGMSNAPQLSHPSIVTQSLVDILALHDESKIKPYYWIGSDAHTFWKALHNLPTNVVDSVKFGIFQIAPLEQERPPPGIVSHHTIRVRNLTASADFYKALGFKEYGPSDDGKQFLRSGVWNDRAKSWTPLILLEENPNLSPRSGCHNLGMTRLSIFTTDLESDLKKLEAEGLKPMGPVTTHNKLKIAAFKDPDNFVVYFFGFEGPLRFVSKVLQWWKSKEDPNIFHWTINCKSCQHAMAVFEKIGFQTASDQKTDQVIYELLPPFNIDPSTAVIKHIRICRLPHDSVFSTLMEWTSPVSECLDESASNTMTISVSDVYAALDRARKAGMFIPENESDAIAYRKFPIYGEVLVGTAYVEEGYNRIEFCSFTDRR